MSVVVSADLCRLCMETSAVSAVFNSKESVGLPEKAMQCLNIKLREGDGLPSLICQDCEHHLNKFYEFRQKCRSVDKELQTRRTLTRCSNIKQESADSSTDSWKLEMKPELDGLILNGFDHLPDWLPEGSKLKHEESSDESLRRTLEFAHPAHPDTSDDTSEKYHREMKTERCTETFAKAAEIEAYKKLTLVQCELCGKTFKHKAILKKHLGTHTGVKLYSCKLCHKKFTRAEHEVVHMRAHLDIRPFVCEVCARAFTKRQDLLRHMRIHSDEKKFGCPRCERKFKRSGDVRSHMRSHTGDKPYACFACHKTYSSHSGLKKHHRVHCGELADKPA